MSDKFEFDAIGVFHGASSHRWSAPRQGSQSAGSGEVVLNSGMNFEQALQDIDGFKRIWLVYVFHRNTNWKPMVQPQNVDRKVGVFASRAPYRPNAIGMTCASLSGVDGLTLNLKEVDLLDGTPILDIKPYIPYADSFSSEEVLGDNCWWSPAKNYAVEFSEDLLEQARWLFENAQFDLLEPIRAQLATQPVDSKRKRVQEVDGMWQLALRTWRVVYTVDESRCTVTVRRILSGLSDDEMQAKQAEWPGEENSLDLHRQFNQHFSN